MKKIIKWTAPLLVITPAIAVVSCGPSVTSEAVDVVQNFGDKLGKDEGSQLAKNLKLLAAQNAKKDEDKKDTNQSA